MHKIIGKIKSSLSTKIFFGIMAVLISVCLMIFASLRILMPKTFETEQNAKFTADLHVLASQLETVPIEDIWPYLTSFAINYQSGITVYDQDNNSIASIGYSDGTHMSAGISSATYCTIFFENDGKPYYISTGLSGIPVDQLTGTFGYVFPYIFVVIVIISALAAFLYSRVLAKPIVDISNISKRMTDLDMTWQCDIKRSDEIGVLANNLNQMASNLDNALTELTEANKKLREDIEWERRQEKQRRDFFTAISHELKTPVAVLKGELEGMILKIGKFKDRDAYLQEAFETTESIETLVREIMSLAKMNMDEMKLMKQDVKLNDMVTDCIKTYEELAAERQIIIRQAFEAELTCRADQMNLKKAISNIIGNAVHHSPEMAAIDVTIGKSGGKGILSVENSGVHIPEEGLERIFEPFYRLDRSRSRHTGGSGLGLYIVKNILDAHGFEYSLANTENGVRFVIVFSS